MSFVDSSASRGDRWLSRYAKLVVALTFLLIFIGGQTTTTGAGMAFPDWPLSHGSLNPHGWWHDMMMRLEHSHRATAGLAGIAIGVLCAWVWRSRWGVPLALGSAVLGGATAKALGASTATTALAGIGVSGLAFAVLLLRAKAHDAEPRSAAVRWTAFAAFLGVCAQAVLGGLRVILDPQGVAPASATVATTFRVLHGCFAQIELCLVVALAAMLSPLWRRLPPVASLGSAIQLGWATVVALFLQLLVGATMRHVAAGLAIPTWPRATAEGGWLPQAHNLFVDLNFTHTRVGALLITAMILHLFCKILYAAPGIGALVRPAALLLALLVAQVMLGVLVIWNGRPEVITTLHVVNGAALLATTLALTLRAQRAGSGSARFISSAFAARPWTEVAA